MSTTMERFWAKVDKTDTCWLWTGAKNQDGYGIFMHSDRGGAAHRWLWTQTNGPLSPTLQLDHLCRVRNCVNPAHLEPVTPSENVRRSTAPAAFNAVKTRCNEGHEFTAENTRIEKGGRRRCLTCQRVKGREFKRASRARQKAA